MGVDVSSCHVHIALNDPRTPQPQWDTCTLRRVAKDLLGEPASALHTVVLGLCLKAPHALQRRPWVGQTTRVTISMNQDLASLGSWSAIWSLISRKPSPTTHFQSPWECQGQRTQPQIWGVPSPRDPVLSGPPRDPQGDLELFMHAAHCIEASMGCPRGAEGLGVLGPETGGYRVGDGGSTTEERRLSLSREPLSGPVSPQPPPLSGP